MTVEVLLAQALRKSKVRPLRRGEQNKRRDKPTRTQGNPYAEVLLLEGARRNNQPRTNNGGRRLTGTSFAHHPRTEKQGIEIHRSINAEATTVDQAPGRLLRRGLMS
jgi:hypothetical protein